jgi:hypothetical protein
MYNKLKKQMNKEELIDCINELYYNYYRFKIYYNDLEIKQFKKEIRSLKYYLNKQGD